MSTTFISATQAVSDESIIRHFTASYKEGLGCVELCSASGQVGDQTKLFIFAETSKDMVVLTEDNVMEFVRLVSNEIGGVLDLDSGLDRIAGTVEDLREDESETATWLEGLLCKANRMMGVGAC